MQEESFYIGSHAASEFGALLQSSYSVSGSAITQNYVVSCTGSRITPCSTLYGLRTISLPIDIYGDTPEDAAAKRSALTAALLDNPVELYLPDGGIYTALLEDSGRASPWDVMGCLLSCTYTLAGYKHGPLETVIADALNDTILFFAAGNAPHMECRLVAVASSTAVKTVAVKISYPDGGSCTVTGLQTGDTVIVDGLEKQVLVNGQNAFQNVTAISGWPTVSPGENRISVPSDGNTRHSYTIEYYPIFV